MMRKTSLCRLFVGCLWLAACGDESEPGPSPEPAEHVDGGASHADGGAADAGGSGHDGGAHDADGGVPTDTDGGAPEADGGTPSGGARGFFLSTGEEAHNTSPATILLDAADGTHFVYPAYAGGGAYYAYCAAGACTDTADMEVVRFDTEGTVANAMVALTKDGKPRVLLASFAKVYYARCDADCGKEASWSVAMIHDHANTKELTGRAFALDANGHPRFLIHTYRALFGIGQRTPQTELFACDAACDSPASWSATKVSDSIWYGSVLRYGAEGAVHVATTECAYEGTSPKGQLLGYLTCTDGACTAPESFHGIGFGTPYENSSEAVAHKFTIDLELTRAGSPRVALIAKLDSAEKKVISYGECLAGKSCTAVDGWAFYGFDGGERIGAGLDLALDADDHPHIAYTSSYDIVSATCDEGCTDTTRAKTPWRSDVLREQTALLATDDIFLFPNCNVGAWLFANPAIALTQDGAYRATYEARDISGVLGPQDPTMPGCTAGTDMVLGRAAFY